MTRLLDLTGLSPDPVPRLQKKIETSQAKLLAVQNAKKPSWEVEADKLAGGIEAAQAEVKGWIARRGVVRSMSVGSIPPAKAARSDTDCI